jgi:hypothetical protein
VRRDRGEGPRDRGKALASLQYWQAVSTRAQAAAAPSRGGAAGRAGLAFNVFVLAGLFAGALIISGFTIFRGGAEFDEGVVLAAAGRVARGEVPYRDFLWPYGPAQPYVLGAWSELLGPSLMSWRVLRVLCDAAVAVVVYVLVRRDAPPWLALAAWLTAACAMAQPTSASPFPFALLSILIGYALVTRGRSVRSAEVVGAGVLVAVAAAWRLDFALYGAAAIFSVMLLRPGPGRGRSLGLFAAIAVGLTGLVYAPFATLIGPADLYDELIGKSLREKDWWTLPFPFSYDGGLRLWPPGALAADAKDAVGFYLPLLVVAGLVAAAVAWLPRAREAWRLTGLLVLGACLVAYLLSRTDEFHVTPLLVVLAAALPLCMAVTSWRPAALACAALLAVPLLQGMANRGSALLDPPALDTIEVPVADGAQAPPAEAHAIERMVATVKRLVPPGQPIYAPTLRSDLVRFNEPRIYVLTERPNAAPADFGLLARAQEQREAVVALERERPRAVVRWLDPISVVREPNRRGEPSGSRQLDDYLVREYRRLVRFGDYEILVPRASDTRLEP